MLTSPHEPVSIDGIYVPQQILADRRTGFLEPLKSNARVESLTALCRKHGIALVYLFGSQKSTGNAYLQGRSVRSTPGGDLDIGVVFRTMPEERMQAYGAIYADLAEVFDPFSVDPVFLQETDYLFQFQAIKGHLAYAESDEAVDAYEDRVLRFASDIAFHLESFQMEVMEAFKNGYFQIG